MNDRIRELEKQCWSHRVDGVLVDGHLHFDTKKFAELIVRECINIAYEYDAPKMSGPGMIIGNRIEEHFGVGMSTEDKKTLIKELLGVKSE